MDLLVVLLALCASFRIQRTAAACAERRGQPPDRLGHGDDLVVSAAGGAPIRIVYEFYATLLRLIKRPERAGALFTAVSRALTRFGTGVER